MLRVILLLLSLFTVIGCVAESAPLRNHALSAPVQFQDMQGRHYSVESITEQNRKVALVFWQTWCSSCIKEAPSLVRAAQQWAGKIDFFGVISGPDDVVDEQSVVAMVSKLQIPYPQIRDRDLRLTNRFNVTGTPTVVVLGAAEEVLFNKHSIPDWRKFATPQQHGIQRSGIDE